MPADEWKECLLGDVIELKRGYDLPQQDRRIGQYPIVSSSGPSGFHDEPKAKGPGVVTGRYGTIGQVFYITEDYWPLNTTLYVKDFKGNDPRFISYFLRSIDFLAYSDKAAVPGVNRNHLHEAKVKIPKLGAQLRIADILGTLDDKIELNRKSSDTLEKMVRSIFKSWFMDFDPVHAKREGKKPFGMPESAAALFPKELVQSEVAEIPRGWATVELGSFVEVVSGTTPRTSENSFWSPEEHAWATPKDLSGQTGLYLTKTERRISSKGLEEIGSGLLPTGSVLMSSRAPIGYVAILDMPTAINQGFAGIKVASPGHCYFMDSWCRFNLETVKSHANGSTFQEISKSSFKKLLVVAPPKSILDQFAQLVGPYYNLLRNAQLESQSLAQARDMLLPRLLSGELNPRLSSG